MFRSPKMPQVLNIRGQRGKKECEIRASHSGVAED